MAALSLTACGLHRSRKHPACRRGWAQPPPNRRNAKPTISSSQHMLTQRLVATLPIIWARYPRLHASPRKGQVGVNWLQVSPPSPLLHTLCSYKLPQSLGGFSSLRLTYLGAGICTVYQGLTFINVNACLYCCI